MKKFIVIALSVGALGNRIFESGQTVTENDFPEGNAEKLVEQGFLKPAGEAEEKEESADGIAEENADEYLGEAGATVKSIDDFTRTDLMTLLDENNISYSKNASKTELYALWIKK